MFTQLKRQFSQNNNRQDNQARLAGELSQIMQDLPVKRGYRRNGIIPQNSNSWTLGIHEIDRRLPENGLARAGLHEIEPLYPSEMPFLTGFAFSLIARLRSHKPVLWCATSRQIGDHGQLYAHGVERYGIHPRQIIMVRVPRSKDLYFSLEEALKTKNIAAVMGEGPLPDFTGSRRLALLAKRHKTPCLFINDIAEQGQGSASLTRWQVTPTSGPDDPADPYGPGPPCWQVALPRVRGGYPTPKLNSRNPENHPWRIIWDEKTLSFHSTTIFCNRAIPENTAKKKPATKTMVG